MSDMHNVKPVLARDTERCKQAVVVPLELFSSDGRKFLLTKWAPVVDVEKVVTVTIEAIVCVPDSENEESP